MALRPIALIVAALLALAAPPRPARADDPPMPGTVQRQVFLNVNALGYTSFLFADALAEGRAVSVAGSGASVDAPLGPDGRPTGDVEILWIATGQEYAHGTYGIDFVGRAEVDFPGALTPPVVSPLVYDAATNRTTGTATFAPGTLGNTMVAFRKTKRTPTSPEGSGLDEFHLYRPTEVGGNTPHERGELFNRQDLAMLAPFAGVRVLNLINTNGNPGKQFDDAANTAIENTGQCSPRDLYSQSWAERRLPSAPIQTVHGDYKDVALEYLIALANSDPRGIKGDQALHMPIPDWVSDEWIDNFYLMCRWGSDGVLPYTGPPGSTTINPHTGQANPQPAGGPRWAGLRGRLFVEYSNEVWNFGPGFLQAGRHVRRAQREVVSGNLDLAWDGMTAGDGFVLANRWVGRGIKRLSDRGKAILAPGAYGTTFFPVLMGQQGNGAVTQNSLDYLEHAVGAAGVKDVVTHVGCGWYRDYDTFYPGGGMIELIGLTTSQIIGAGVVDTGEPAAHVVLCKKYGVKFLGYEGGQCVTGGDRARTWLALHSDPRTWRYTRSCIDEAFVADPVVEVLEVFADTAGQWALLETPGLRDAPEAGKYRATVAAIQAWAANPLDGTDPSPLPPVATITGIVASVPAGPIIPGQPLQLVGSLDGTNDPIPLLTWVPSEGVAPAGRIVVPPAANRPRTVKVKVAAIKAPQFATLLEFTIPADPAGPPPIADPSFELGTIPANAPAGFAAPPTGSGWAWAGGGISRNGIGYGGNHVPTPGGDQFAFLQTGSGLSQSITGWGAGTYRVGFSGSQRNYNGNAQTLSIKLDGVQVGIWSGPVAGDGAYQWAPYQTAPFAVAAGDHTLSIAGLATGDATALVDAVTLTKVSGGTGPVIPGSPTLPVLIRELLERLRIVR